MQTTSYIYLYQFEHSPFSDLNRLVEAERSRGASNNSSFASEGQPGLAGTACGEGGSGGDPLFSHLFICVTIQ